MKDLEFYGDTYSKMQMEGEGYYVTDYASVSHFEGDDELKAAFIAAEKGMNGFTSLLEQRIKELGGDLSDYEA